MVNEIKVGYLYYDGRQNYKGEHVYFLVIEVFSKVCGNSVRFIELQNYIDGYYWSEKTWTLHDFQDRFPHEYGPLSIYRTIYL